MDEREPTKFTIRPWRGSENLYFYPQSSQICGQTGQIGRMRADFDRDGHGFFYTWEDSRSSLKTEKFKRQFDDVINALRFGDGETPLESRRALTNYLRDRHFAILPNDDERHGFRADTDEYSFLFRVKPTPGDYDVYVWCYRKDWLDNHMEQAEKGIRFVDSQYREKFRIPDGGKIRITYPDGESFEKECRYIDDTHFELDRGQSPFSLYHIDQFAEQMERAGATVVPVDDTEPVENEREMGGMEL